jgi:hypothetical protein
MGAFLIGIISTLKVVFSDKPQYVAMRKETGNYLTQHIETPIVEACERVHRGEPLLVKKPPVQWRSNKQMFIIIVVMITVCYLLSLIVR